MADTVTTTTSTGFGERIKSGLKNILGGLALVILAIVLLYRNEGRALQTTQSRDEVAAKVISIPSDTVDSTYEGKLVHTYGDVQTQQTVSDSEFGITPLSHTIALQRKAEMYQRQEKSETKTKEKIGGSQEQITTYSYYKGRSDTVIDSSTFAESSTHPNPAIMLYQNYEDRVSEASLGAFELSEHQIKSMNKEQKFAYTETMLSTLTGSLLDRASIHDGILYLGSQGKVKKDQATIGDYRISRYIIPVDTISLIAQQSGKSFRPYQTQAGDSIDAFADGNVSHETMITTGKNTNQSLTWILRIGGILLIMMGISMLTSIIHILASVLPFLGGITQLSLGLVAGVLGLVIGLLTIALAWLTFRPFLSLILFGCAAILLIIMLSLRQSKSTPTPATETPSPQA